MAPFLTFFLIMLVGMLSSTLRSKFHFPWVVALVIGGIILGPYALDIFQPNDTSEFLGQLGLIFLMFMAGLETKLSSFKESSRDLYLLALINGLIPFLLGGVIGYFLGYSTTTMFMMGVVFISSSVAVVIPTLESNNLFEVKIGRSVIITSIIQDIASLVLLSILLQNVSPTSNIPLYLFYPILAVVLVAFRYLLPKLEDLLTEIIPQDDDLFQSELRPVVLILIGTVIIFELLGLHSIIGGFFAGLVLSDSVTNKVLIGKIRAISYGIFIPTFFVLTGIKTNIGVLFELDTALLLVTLIVVGSIASKFISGLVAAKFVGFNTPQSVFFGVSSIPQLSTTLAVSYTANNLGIISNELSTAFVALSIVSTVVGSFLMSRFSKDSLTIGTSEKISLKINKRKKLFKPAK